MLNRQGELTLPRPTAAPTATQLRVVLTLQFCVTGRSMDLISIEDEAVAKAR